MHLYINLSITFSLTIIIKTTISLAQCVCVCTYSKRKETRILHGTGKILKEKPISINSILHTEKHKINLHRYLLCFSVL